MNRSRKTCKLVVTHQPLHRRLSSTDIEKEWFEGCSGAQTWRRGSVLNCTSLRTQWILPYRRWCPLWPTVGSGQYFEVPTTPCSWLVLETFAPSTCSSLKNRIKMLTSSPIKQHINVDSRLPEGHYGFFSSVARSGKACDQKRMFSKKNPRIQSAKQMLYVEMLVTNDRSMRDDGLCENGQVLLWMFVVVMLRTYESRSQRISVTRNSDAKSEIAARTQAPSTELTVLLLMKYERIHVHRHENKVQRKTLSKEPELGVFRSTMCSAETTQPKTLKLIPLIGTWKWNQVLESA